MAQSPEGANKDLLFTCTPANNGLGGSADLFQTTRELKGAEFLQQSKQSVEVITLNHPLISVEFHQMVRARLGFHFSWSGGTASQSAFQYLCQRSRPRQQDAASPGRRLLYRRLWRPCLRLCQYHRCRCRYRRRRLVPRMGLSSSGLRGRP